MPSPNQDLIRELQVLLDQAKLGTDPNDKYRVKSYKTAIEKIAALSKKISEEKDIPLNKLTKTYAKVKEFLDNGFIGKTQEVLKENEEVLDIYRELQKIAEVGPVKAKELIEEYGIRSIKELRERQELLNDKQRIGLKYLETDQMRIPRAEIKKHETIYRAQLKIAENCGEIQLSINGSYRRGAKDSGDIDILITHPQNNIECFKAFVDSLLKNGYIKDTLAYGEKKFMGYGSLFKTGSTPRRVDIIYCPPHEFPFAQLYFTGCGSFNVRMREYASKKGYRLNEKGLVDLKTEHFVKGSFKKEEDIFTFLGLTYVEPKMRVEDYIF